MINDNDNKWQNDALCKTQAPEIFYPEMDSSHGQKIARFAIKICDDCPVRVKCVKHGIHHERYGIWGGMTEGQRKNYRKKHNITLDADNYRTRHFISLDNTK